MKRFQPKWLRIEERARDYPMTRELLQKLQGTPVEWISDWKSEGGRGFSINERFKFEKGGLVLAVKDGALVKQVDRDLYREIPGEFYIIHAMGCPFDCQYCFLFDYLDHQIPTIFVNVDAIVAAVGDAVAGYSGPATELVFHAGEFSDALAFDHLTNLSAPLIETFATFANARLELRTKSDNVENLLGIDHRGRTTVSWTFSPQPVVKNIEFATASLAERIEAARRCQQAGYPVGLRFDPIVYADTWERDYADLISALFSRLDPAGIHDCSLGIYRATPRLNNIVRRRFPRSRLYAGEMEQAGDGKYRYLRPQRVRILRRLIEMLRDHAAGLQIELCMESPEVEAALRPLLRRQPAGRRA